MTTTLAAVARKITDTLDMEYDAALTLATTYAAQLDYDVPEGGQAPDVEITDDDAECILGTAKAGSEDSSYGALPDLTDAVEAARVADDAARAAESDRDAVIRRSLKAGARVVDITEATGLSRARIYQIRDGIR